MCCLWPLITIHAYYFDKTVWNYITEHSERDYNLDYNSSALWRLNRGTITFRVQWDLLLDNESHGIPAEFKHLFHSHSISGHCKWLVIPVWPPLCPGLCRYTWGTILIFPSSCFCKHNWEIGTVRTENRLFGEVWRSLTGFHQHSRGFFLSYKLHISPKYNY